MKYFSLFIQNIVVSATIVIYLVSGEYDIKNDRRLSYLYHKFENIDGGIFPSDIRIKASLSRMLGTLLYSIDQNMNQLIITLHDSTPAVLGIEFNKQRLFESMTQLCGCTSCRYEKFDLRIIIREGNLYVQCNGGDVKQYDIPNTVALNEDYPIPFNRTNSKPTTPNIGHLWLVNTPKYGNLLPNYAQTYGCIFNVLYNNKAVIFKNYTQNVGSKCNKVCVGDICNGGHCFESYNTFPVCNCAATFRNGRYCNETTKSQNLMSVSFQFACDMFKLSWKSDMNTIFQLKNKKVNILLDVNNHSLVFQYDYSNGYQLKTQTILTNNYTRNKEYVLLVHFLDRAIDTSLLTNNSSTNLNLPIKCDLSQEVFDSIMLRSGVGIIDFAYKNSHEYEYSNIYINNYTNISYSTEMSTATIIMSSQYSNPRSTTLRHEIPAALVIALCALIIIAILYFKLKKVTCKKFTLKWKRDQRRKDLNYNNGEDESYISRTDTNCNNGEDESNTFRTDTNCSIYKCEEDD